MHFYPGLTPMQWLNTPTVWIEGLLAYSSNLQAVDNIHNAVSTHADKKVMQRWQKQVTDMDTSKRNAPIPSKETMIRLMQQTGARVGT